MNAYPGNLPPSKKILLITAAVFFGCPIALNTTIGHLPISAVDFFLLLALPYALYSNRTPLRFATPLIISATIGLTLILLNLVVCSLSAGDFFYSTGAWAFFFKPFLAFVIGYTLLQSPPSIRTFIQYLTPFIALFALIVTYLQLTGLYDVKAGISFLGDRLTIAGTLGRNMFLTYLAYAGMVIASAQSLFPKKSTVTFYIWVTIGLITVCLIVNPSRQAFASWGLFWLLKSLLGNKHKITTIAFIAVLFAAAFFSTEASNELIGRIKYTLYAILETDITTISSGRNQIASKMLAEFQHSPLQGTAFGSNLSLHHATRTGTTPHHLYLSALWKMGLLGSIPLFYFIGKTWINSIATWLRSKSDFSRNLCISTCIMLGPLALVFEHAVAPYTGALFWLMAGATLRAYHTLRHQLATGPHTPYGANRSALRSIQPHASAHRVS